MRDIAQVQSILQKYPFEAKGHCRVDYTDPLTGKVLERIEGDNHVFIDQFMAIFQTTCLNSTLLLTDGEQELDTDLPYLPGKPIGYGNPGTSATGIFQGSYRGADSFYNVIGRDQVTSMYIYDFLSTQIPDTIRYVGLTGAQHYNSPSTLFSYRWPRNSFAGIYDIERKRLLYGGTCSLSNDAGGSGSLYIYSLENAPGATAKKLDIFNVCEKPDNYFTTLQYVNYAGNTYNQDRYSQGYQATWGYDYENQYVVVKITRYCFDRYYDRVYNEAGTSYNNYYFYTLRFRDDIYVVSSDGSELVKHFTYNWTEIEAARSDEPSYLGTTWQYYYHFWTGNSFSGYVRLYGDELYAFSKTPENYSGTAYANVWYEYHYDITTGGTYCEKHTENPRGNNCAYCLQGDGSIMYCYKGYTWVNGTYNPSVSVDGTSRSVGYGFSEYAMGVIPMFDLYSGSVYTFCPVVTDSSNYGYSPIQKGLTNIYGKTWCYKPYFSTSSFDAETSYSRCNMPFAYTAYQLPGDAPKRPENSAVTIAYGLTITW